MRGRGADSEFLRAEHGNDEVEEGGEGDQADEEVFHDGWGKAGLADLFAEVGVGEGEGEEGDREAEIDEVGVHGPSISRRGPAA
jgi:hypothetical protein